MAANARPRKSRFHGTWDSLCHRRNRFNSRLSQKAISPRSVMWTSRLEYCLG